MRRYSESENMGELRPVVRRAEPRPDTPIDGLWVLMLYGLLSMALGAICYFALWGGR